VRAGFSSRGDESPQRQRFEALLCDEVYQAAWRFAYRLSPSREEAEDLLQETLSRAYARLGQLRDPAAFKPWLFAILRNAAGRQAARLRLLSRREIGLETEVHAVPALPGVEGLSFELAAALAAVPAQQREVLLLHYLDGLSLAELGVTLGCGERAAKQRLYRARSGLRRLLTGSAAQADFSALL